MGWRSKVSHVELKTARTVRVSERFSQYLIFYQPFQDRIEILRVVHGAQHLSALFAKRDAFD
jgi:plasmid stabilization system protein ParE